MSYRVRMILPLLATFAAAVGYPLLYSLYLSMTNYRITSRSNTRFVGLDQYKDVLSNQAYWSAIRVTAIFVVFAVACQHDDAIGV